MHRGSLPVGNSEWETDHQPSHLRAFSLARILIVATLLAAPLAFGAVVPWAWAALGLLSGVGLSLWAYGCSQRSKLRLIWSPLYIPLALFFLLAVVQYAAGRGLEGSETRQALVLLGEDLALYFLAVQLFAGSDSEQLRSFGLTVLVFGGCLGLFAILQFASGTHRIYGIVDTPTRALFGPYVNPDHFAGLMEMLIPIGILYIAGQRTSGAFGASALRVFAATLALASLMLSGSRGGLLALAAEIAIAAIAFRRVITRTKEGKRLAIAAAISLLAGVVLFVYVDRGGAAKRLGSVANIDRTWADWAGERKNMAHDALRMWHDHPILGVGLGDFEIVYPRYQSFASDDYIDHAHNDYLEALAETGLAGAVLILWALGLFLAVAFRSQEDYSHAGWVRTGAAIGCCGMLLHSLWDFNLHIPANAAWFAVLAGLATAATD